MITGQLLVGKWTLVHGARATGKSTVLEDVRVELEGKELIVLSIDVSGIEVSAAGGVYWENLTALVAEALLEWLPSNAPSDLRERVEAFSSGPGSMERFQELFKRSRLSALFSHKDLKDKKVVLLIDELSKLFDEHQMAEAKIKSADASEREQGRNAQENVASTLDALRSLKNSTSPNALHAMAAVGVHSLTDPSVHGRAAPFNVAPQFDLGNLTEGEVQALFREYREEHKVDIAEGVIEDIFRLTRGHAGLVHVLGRCLTYGETGQASDMSDLFKGLRVDRTVGDAFAALSLPSELACSFSWISEPVAQLSRPDQRYADARRAAMRVFVPAEGPVRVDGQLGDNARLLCAVDEVELETFEVASPLMRQILIRKVLPVDFPKGITEVPPERADQSLDALRILQTLAPHVVNLVLALPKESYKQAGGNGMSNLMCPPECAYETHLAHLLTAWLSAHKSGTVSEQVKRDAQGMVLRDSLGKELIPDLVVRGALKGAAVYELMATDRLSSIESHLEKRTTYAATIGASEAWVIHFTLQRPEQLAWPECIPDKVALVQICHHLLGQPDPQKMTMWVKSHGDTEAIQMPL